MKIYETKQAYNEPELTTISS